MSQEVIASQHGGHRRRRLIGPGRAKPFISPPMHVLTAGASGTGIFPPSDPTTIPPLTSHSGPVLLRPTIKPIFWGGEWTAPSPPIAPATILASITQIIDGPYLDALAQYGFTGKPMLLDPLFVTSSEPNKTPTASGWSSEAAQFLNGLIEDEHLPEPDEDWSRLNVIFMPSTVAYPITSTGTEWGFHSTFQWVDYDLFDLDNDPVRYAVIGTAPVLPISGLDMTTYIFSHELVEAMTDPDVSSGWRRYTGGDDEIADAPCNQIGRINGVAVASYWSNADKACIIPWLVRTAYFEIETPIMNGAISDPEQSFHVDQSCGRNYHWVGDYTYHIEQRRLMVTCVGKPRNWLNPTGKWLVAGQAVRQGAPQIIRTELTASFPGHPSSTSSTRTVTITATATNDRLELRNDPNDGVYQLPVEYRVMETFNDSNADAHAASWTIDVDIEGQALVYSEVYIKALQRCWQQQLGAFGHDVKGIREIQGELADLIAKHRGPPINETVLASLARAAMEEAQELRSFAHEVRQLRRALDVRDGLRMPL